MLTDTKTIYILYSYYPGDDNSTAVGWSESEEELKELKAQLEKKLKCPYGKKKRSKIDGAMTSWALVEEQLWDKAILECPYFDESRIPHVRNTKKYGEYLDALEAVIKAKRGEWFNENFPDLTTHEELAAYDEFLEKENWHTGYYIDKLNHI